MKLLLAGLLVFAGVLAAVSVIGEEGFETWPGSAVAAVLLAGALLPGLLAWRFLRGGHPEVRLERLVRATRARVRRGEPLRPSAMEHRVEFDARPRDGLEAARVRRRHATGARGWVRGAVLLMGFAWLAGFFLTLPSGPSGRGPSWTWLALGSLVVFFFLLLPAWHSLAALREGATRGRTVLHVTARGLRVELPNEPASFERWMQVADVVPSRTGVLFRFQDGRQVWVPRRALGGAAAYGRFVADVEERVAQEVVRFDEVPTPHPNFPAVVPGIIADTRQVWAEEGESPCFEVEVHDGDARRRLRFERPEGVEFVGPGAHASDDDLRGVAVYAMPHAGLDGIAVLALGADEHGTRFRLAAEAVVEPGVPPVAG